MTAAQKLECPEKEGVQTYPNTEYCDRFFLCVNGTLTEEECENGLAYDGVGSVHNHCNYNWAVDCANGARVGAEHGRIYDDTPLSSPGCLYRSVTACSL